MGLELNWGAASVGHLQLRVEAVMERKDRNSVGVEVREEESRESPRRSSVMDMLDNTKGMT